MSDFLERLKSDRNFQLVIGGIVVGLLIIFWLFHSLASKSKPTANGGSHPITCYNQTFTIWSPFNYSAFDKLSQSLRGYCIGLNLVQKSESQIEADLVSSLAAANNPPDLVYVSGRYYSDNKNIFENSLAGLPLDTNNYPDGVKKFIVQNPGLYPVTADALVSFWNVDYFNSIGLSQPPATFEAITGIVPELRKKDSSGNFSLAPVALGAANNIDHSAEIFAAIAKMIGGVNFNGQNYNSVELMKSLGQAFDFYTQFADQNSNDYSWNENMDNDLKLFSQNKVALIFDYYSVKDQIAGFNPRLNFAIAPFPHFQAYPLKTNFLKVYYFALPKIKPVKLAAMKIILTQLDKNYGDLTKQAKILPLKLSLAQNLSGDEKIVFNEIIAGESFSNWNLNFLKQILPSDFSNWITNKQETGYLIGSTQLNQIFTK